MQDHEIVILVTLLLTTKLQSYSVLLSTSTHADRQGVDMSFPVFFVCVFVRLWISLPKIKIATSYFARQFIESHILGNFAPLEAQNRTNEPVHGLRSVLPI